MVALPAQDAGLTLVFHHVLCQSETFAESVGVAVLGLFSASVSWIAAPPDRPVILLLQRLRKTGRSPLIAGTGD